MEAEEEENKGDEEGEDQPAEPVQKPSKP